MESGAKRRLRVDFVTGNSSAVRKRLRQGDFDKTPILSNWAPRVEHAAFWRVQGTWYIALENNSISFPFDDWVRDRNR